MQHRETRAAGADGTHGPGLADAGFQTPAPIETAVETAMDLAVRGHRLG